MLLRTKTTFQLQKMIVFLSPSVYILLDADYIKDIARGEGVGVGGLEIAQNDAHRNGHSRRDILTVIVRQGSGVVAEGAAGYYLDIFFSRHISLFFFLPLAGRRPNID